MFRRLRLRPWPSDVYERHDERYREQHESRRDHDVRRADDRYSHYGSWGNSDDDIGRNHDCTRAHEYQSVVAELEHQRSVFDEYELEFSKHGQRFVE